MYWLCETCNGRGWVREQHLGWFKRMESRKTCPTCKGDGHARPPEGKPVIPPPPPKERT